MSPLTRNDIASFFAGNQEAAEKVYFSYRNLMYFVIASYVKNRDDCDDILSESFVRLLASRNEEKDIKNLKSYCAAIARNQALDFLRKQKELSDYDDAYYGNEEPSQVFMELEPLLSKKQLLVLYYKAVFGYKWDEISKMTGIPNSSLRAIYKEAKDKIRKEGL